MGNCFVERLMAIAQNDNMYKLGFQKTAFSSQYNYGYEISAAGFEINVHVVINKDGKFVKSGVEYTELTNQGWNFNVVPDSGKTCYVDTDILTSNAISGRYNFTDAAVSTAVLAIDMAGEITETFDYGDISQIASTYPNLQCLLAKNTRISGNIMYFVGCSNISYLKFVGSYIEGDIKDFAESQVENGRTSGTVTIIASGRLKNNGELIGSGVTKTITYNSSLPNGYSIS